MNSDLLDRLRERAASEQVLGCVMIGVEDLQEAISALESMEPAKYPDNVKVGDWIKPTIDSVSEFGEAVQVLAVRTYESDKVRQVSFAVKKYTEGKPHGFTVERGSIWFSGFAPAPPKVEQEG